MADNAADPKLPADLAGRAAAMHARLKAQGDLLNWNQGAGHGWFDAMGDLYRTAAEMQGILGHP